LAVVAAVIGGCCPTLQTLLQMLMLTPVTKEMEGKEVCYHYVEYSNQQGKA